MGFLAKSLKVYRKLTETEESLKKRKALLVGKKKKKKLRADIEKLEKELGDK